MTTKYQNKRAILTGHVGVQHEPEQVLCPNTREPIKTGQERFLNKYPDWYQKRK